MPNELMRELWTKHGGPAWIENRRIFESVYAPFNEAVVKALDPLEGLTVLDVGCGTGSLSQSVVEHGGIAVGIDISETMIEGARELVPDATFYVADAQVDSLGEYALGGFDRVTSRFGVMFFEDPVAAFVNIRAATKPGGRMVFVCWRSIQENPTFTLGTHLLVERLPEPPVPAGPRAPGPALFADPEYVKSVLTEAGWSDVDVESFEAMCRYGIDGSDGVEERMVMIMTNVTGRLATEQLRPALGEERWQALLDEVRDEVRTAIVDGEVAFPGRTWIVSATNPR